MLKIEKVKNNKGLEFNTLDIGELTNVSQKMYEINDNHYSMNKFYGQCVQCAKGIKHKNTSYSVVCILSPQIIVDLNQEETARDHGGFMESFEIGPECGRRIKKAIKDLGLNWKDYLYVHKEVK
tara:strand:- start:904 stop:1275 length:372 start_codon:yes stop_codon:yes gene_type:complete